MSTFDSSSSLSSTPSERTSISSRSSLSPRSSSSSHIQDTENIEHGPVSMDSQMGINSRVQTLIKTSQKITYPLLVIFLLTFLFSLSVGFNDLLLYYTLKSKICRSSKSDHVSISDLVTDPDCASASIQKKVAVLIAWTQTVEALLGLALNPIYGAFGDRYGRKTALQIASVFLISTNPIYILVSACNFVPAELVILASVVSGLGGNITIVFALLNSSILDVCDLNYSSTFLGLNTAILQVGNGLGVSLVGYFLSQEAALSSLYAISTTSRVLFVIVSLYFIGSTNRHHHRARDESYMNVLAVFKTITFSKLASEFRESFDMLKRLPSSSQPESKYQRSLKKRRAMILTLVITTLLEIQLGPSAFVPVYLEHKFKTSPSFIGTIQSSLQLGGAFSSGIVMPALFTLSWWALRKAEIRNFQQQQQQNHHRHANMVWLVILFIKTALIVGATGLFTLAISQNLVQVVLSISLIALGNMTSPLLQSLGVSSIKDKYIGRYFGLFGSFAALGHIVRSPLISGLYYMTVDTFDGAIYLFGSLIATVNIVLANGIQSF